METATTPFFHTTTTEIFGNKHRNGIAENATQKNIRINYVAHKIRQTTT